jgi:hypothetical protein
MFQSEIMSSTKRSKLDSVPSQKIAIHALKQHRAIESKAAGYSDVFKTFKREYISTNNSVWWTTRLGWTCWDLFCEGRSAAQSFFAENMVCLVAIRARMPHTGSYSRSLDFTEPILGSLTSLHAADSENDDHLRS